MKRKQTTRAIALILSASITMTSVPWNHLFTVKASEIEENGSILRIGRPF